MSGSWVTWAGCGLVAVAAMVLVSPDDEADPSATPDVASAPTRGAKPGARPPSDPLTSTEAGSGTERTTSAPVANPFSTYMQVSQQAGASASATKGQPAPIDERQMVLTHLPPMTPQSLPLPAMRRLADAEAASPAQAADSDDEHGN